MTQHEALDILKLGHNVFLTGSAGSGKTHVLNEYIAYLKEKGIAVGITASTGVAATHINGITINSWAGIGIKQTLTESEIATLLQRTYLRRRIRNTSVLVIDEISMLPSHALDMVDLLCQRFRNDDRPFGGMQVILCGDLFQLPPVCKESRETHFVHTANAWHDLDLRVCYLDTEYRQEDEQFLEVLHEIRRNAVSKPSIQMLAKRLYKTVQSETVLPRLYTHNGNVDAINAKELENLPGDPHIYSMHTEGNEYLADIMKKSCLAPEKLTLKKGALVMFVKNNFEKGYVNGTVGTVVDFTSRLYPIVETISGELVTVTQAEWSIEEDGEVKALIKQLPLRLAWAITIHKSQGMSLDAAEIDLGKPFLPGMGYVALSRVRSLEGVRLLGLNHKALQVNETVLTMDKQLQKQSEASQEELEQLTWIEREIHQMLFLREMKEAKTPYRYAYTHMRQSIRA